MVQQNAEYLRYLQENLNPLQLEEYQQKKKLQPNGICVSISLAPNLK